MICALVLAGGQSKRMGTQKLLLPWGETTIIGHVVDQLLQTALHRIVVVTGHDKTPVTGELADQPVTLAHNPHYASGMLSSVRCGIRALPLDCEAALVSLGDQPMISSSLIDRMITAFNVTDKNILVPLCNDRRGHPLLFSCVYFDEVLTHFEEIGLRGLLQAHPQDVQELKVSTPSVLGDIDHPEAYQRERERFEGSQ